MTNVNSAEQATQTVVAEPEAQPQQHTYAPPTQQQVQSGDELQFDSSSNAFSEKQLNSAYNSEGQLALNILMDAGASTTRSLVLVPGKKLSRKNIRTTPSQFTILRNKPDLSIYKKTSAEIVDNAEYIITEKETSPNISTSWFVEPVHVIKGNLIKKMNKVAEYIDNQRDKSDHIGIFINMLTEIANYGLEARQQNIVTRLAFTVPPKERYSSRERLNNLISSIAGKYTVEMPRYNYTAHIDISPSDVFVEAECETAYVYLTTVGAGAAERHAEFSDKRITVQDLGSSTFIISLIENGEVQAGTSHTAKTGGENLVSALYSILLAKRREPISFEMAQQAVETGYIQIGGETIPVGPELTQAKEEMAPALAKEFVSFLQQNRSHATSIYSHLFVGRGMMSTGEIIDGKPSPNYSPSMGYLLNRIYAEDSPTTKHIILNNPGYANILGLASIMWATWKIG